MTAFEPRAFAVGRNRYTNWVTIKPLFANKYKYFPKKYPFWESMARSKAVNASLVPNLYLLNFAF